MIPTISTILRRDDIVCRHTCRSQVNVDRQLNFQPVDIEAMSRIWPVLSLSRGRTCDFSYGGLLIWAPLLGYEYAIVNDTLFIRGRFEGDFSKQAFSLPVGAMPLHESVRLLGQWTRKHGEGLRLSAVPEYALPEIVAMHPRLVTELPNWADYMYDITSLASLSGKKMAKKRNHVNKFEATYPYASLREMTPENIPDALSLLERINASVAAESEMAANERVLCASTLTLMATHATQMQGAILYVAERPVAFTVGDIKGDTLFIHLEKADREIAGAYEAINKYFATSMLAANPQLRYVNREDDAGDAGLRKAKESYRPVAKLKKFDITF